MSKNKILSAIALTLSLTIASPFVQPAKAETKAPNIVGKSALVMDIDTGEIIYSKNADDKMYPASITKLLTGVVLADNAQKSDEIKFTSDAKKQPEYSLDINIAKGKIKVGDSMTASDAMKTLLLFSANDWAYAIADTIGGNSQNFAKMMNDEAKKIGMTNSNFVTPNGLHDDNHYTTAYDLSLLSKSAYDNPWVRETMALKNDRVQTSNNIIALIDNRNKNLGVDGCIGGKTGYTEKAGRSLVGIYERDGRHLAGVVLKSEYDQQDTQVFKDMKAIIDYAFSAQKVVTYPKDTVVSKIPVKYKAFRFFGEEKTLDVPVLVKENIAQYENDINKNDTKIDVKEGTLNPWKLKANSDVATLTVKERNSEKTYDAYCNQSFSELTKANIIGYISIILGAVVTILIVATAVLLIKKNLRRRKRYY